MKIGLSSPFHKVKEYMHVSIILRQYYFCLMMALGNI